MDENKITEINEENKTDSLEEARNELKKVINEKVPAMARATIEESLFPVINTLSENDAREMAKMIREKGLLSLLMAGKKKKKELEKENKDLTDGKV